MMNLKEAVEYLKNGYYNDSRMREAVKVVLDEVEKPSEKEEVVFKSKRRIKSE